MNNIEEDFIKKFPTLKQYMYEDIVCKSVFNSVEMQEILLNHCVDKEFVKRVIKKYSIKVYDNPEALTCLSHILFEILEGE